MFENIPKYTGQGERVKQPKEISETTTGIKVSGNCIDPETLYKLALFGANNLELAEFFGTNESQIRYYFNEYLTKARATLKIKLKRAQLKVAIENESTAMLIWCGKQYLGQTDQPVNSTAELPLPWNTAEDDTDAHN